MQRTGGGGGGGGGGVGEIWTIYSSQGRRLFSVLEDVLVMSLRHPPPCCGFFFSPLDYLSAVELQACRTSISGGGGS